MDSIIKETHLGVTNKLFIMWHHKVYKKLLKNGVMEKKDMERLLAMIRIKYK